MPSLRKRALLVSLGLLATLASVSTQAAQLICNYQVTGVTTRADGYVWVTFTGGQTAAWILCNLNAAITVAASGIGSITMYPTTCQANYSMLLTAKGQGRSVDLTFYTDGTPTCANVITAAYLDILNPYPYSITLHG